MDCLRNGGAENLQCTKTAATDFELSLQVVVMVVVVAAAAAAAATTTTTGEEVAVLCVRTQG